MSRWGPRGGVGGGYDDGDDWDCAGADFDDGGLDDGGYEDQAAFSDGEDPDAGFGGLGGTPSRRGPSAPPPRSRAPPGGRSQGPHPGRAVPSGGRAGGPPSDRAPPTRAGGPPPGRAGGARPPTGGAPPRRAPPSGGRQQGRSSAGDPRTAISRHGNQGHQASAAQRHQHGREDEFRYLQTIFRNAAQELAFSITGPRDPTILYEMRYHFQSRQRLLLWIREMQEVWGVGTGHAMHLESDQIYEVFATMESVFDDLMMGGWDPRVLYRYQCQLGPVFRTALRDAIGGWYAWWKR